MLVELVVTDLGVIEHLSLVLGPGMTAVTGETGAGKTLIVEAIELLMGGRADPAMVRPGAAEAVVEGRFVVGDDELILRRVVPTEGRSRAYVDNRLASASGLAETGAALVDLHGQHDHQSLLAPAVQRRALDRFGGIDLEPRRLARKQLASIDERLQALGGDERERAREIDLLRYQVRELDAAAVVDPDEDDRLDAEEDLLGDAAAFREAGERAWRSLTTDGGAGEAMADAIAALDGRAPFAGVVERLLGVAAELTDLASELRSIGDGIEEDPERQAEVRERRHLLRELQRKYGDSLAEVVDFHRQAADRLQELESRDAVAAALDAERAEAAVAVAAAEAALGASRREVAPRLAAATEANLRELAMPKAHVEIEVAGDAGDDVSFRLAANPGSSPLPLAKVASGGELARSMLALRLVLTEAPDTLVFDEVDAGIGGTAAVAVGRALASLAGTHQVLVVTHLAQVAAAADSHVRVTKHTTRTRTRTSVEVLADADRVVEISRMLSGSPDSDTANEHARELLDRAAADRTTTRRR
jgi:DNA repair protein RecN (Recombination protein N)